MSKYIEEAKLDFQANYLDGDDIQGGQMLSSESCFEAIQDALQKQIEMIEGEMQDRKDILIGTGVHPGDVYTQGRVRQLEDSISILNQHK